MTFRKRVVAAAAVATLTSLVVPATASAEPLPGDMPSITMVVRNDTDSPMVLSGAVNEYGRWVDTASSVVAARATETITASSSDRRGFGAQVTYTMPGDATVVLMANNYGTGPANADGTRVDGRNQHRYAVATSVDTGFPFMNSEFTVSRN